MAHFAEIDENNLVSRVVVIANEDITDENDVEQESLGITLCQNLFGEDTTWAQCSYNANFRYNYPSIGASWDSENEAFYDPKPYNSWSLDSNYQWQAPISRPDDGNLYYWDEDVYQADNTEGWILGHSGTIA